MFELTFITPTLARDLKLYIKSCQTIIPRPVRLDQLSSVAVRKRFVTKATTLTSLLQSFTCMSSSVRFSRGTSGLNKLVFVINPSDFVARHSGNYMIFRGGEEVICEAQSVEVRLAQAKLSIAAPSRVRQMS